MAREADKVDLVANFSWISGSAKTPLLVNQLRSPAELALRVVGELHSKSLLIQVGNQLIDLAEKAYGSRELNKLLEIGKVLLTLPLPAEYKNAANYFRAIEFIRLGDLCTAKSLLDVVVSAPAHRYTARALQSLGAVFKLRGDLDSAVKLHLEAGRLAVSNGTNDFLTAVFVRKNLAVLKSIAGDHFGALVDLEQVGPIAKTVGRIHPYVYYDYQNSLAVELCEVGRLEEAAHASGIALSSPLVVRYPEWHQTFDEIILKSKRASSSTVPVRLPVSETRADSDEQQNLLRLPPADHNPQEGDVNGYQSMPARVLSFEHWKAAIQRTHPVNPSVLSKEQRITMTTGEKLIRLMDLISQEETDDETIDSILEAVENIVFQRRRPSPRN